MPTSIRVVLTDLEGIFLKDLLVTSPSDESPHPRDFSEHIREAIEMEYGVLEISPDKNKP